MRYIITSVVTIFLFSLFLSCYSVRIKVSNGPGPEPADTEREDALSGMMVRQLDTIVTVKTTTDENPINIKACDSGAIHTVETKNTMGGILLYLVTFGRKRTVKVTYVCVKDQN